MVSKVETAFGPLDVVVNNDALADLILPVLQLRLLGMMISCEIRSPLMLK